MSAQYDPRQELNPSSVISWGVILTILGFAVVWFIIWGRQLVGV